MSDWTYHSDEDVVKGPDGTVVSLAGARVLKQLFGQPLKYTYNLNNRSLPMSNPHVPDYYDQSTGLPTPVELRTLADQIEGGDNVTNQQRRDATTEAAQILRRLAANGRG